MDRAQMFINFQVVGLGLLAYWAYRRHRQASSSQFGSREYERPLSSRVDPRNARATHLRGDQSLADARLAKKEALLLEGFSLEGLPHQILGVHPDASPAEIQAAYLARMKQYHPDKMATPDTEDWQIAQMIASKINEARQAMLRK